MYYTRQMCLPDFNLFTIFIGNELHLLNVETNPNLIQNTNTIFNLFNKIK